MLITDPFVGSINSCRINDYKRVLQSRNSLRLGYWRVYRHTKIVCTCATMCETSRNKNVRFKIMMTPMDKLAKNLPA